MMRKIEKYNSDGLCHELYCSKRYTQYDEIPVKGLKLNVCLCDDHAKIWDGESGN